MPREARLQPADVAWLTMIVGGLIFEFASDDLLSDSAERMCRRHPILGRLAIFALAGHLGVVLPYHVDLFNAKNVVHRGIVFGCRAARTWRATQAAC